MRKIEELNWILQGETKSGVKFEGMLMYDGLKNNAPTFSVAGFTNGKIYPDDVEFDEFDDYIESFNLTTSSDLNKFLEALGGIPQKALFYGSTNSPVFKASNIKPDSLRILRKI
jgi:hypothetical protein